MWATDPNPAQDSALHPTPVLFTSPLANGRTNYSTIAFETNLPSIEIEGAQDHRPFCNRTTGANCVDGVQARTYRPHAENCANRPTRERARARLAMAEALRSVPVEDPCLLGRELHVGKRAAIM
jgi:hypothetical protein